MRNVKGQKFTLDEDHGGTFVNYAEIWGDNLYLTAAGDCIAAGPVIDPSPISTLAPEEKSTNNPFEIKLASLFGPFKTKSNNVKQPSALLPTPFDYFATVTGASIVFFQKIVLNLAIQGTGTVRVLYADEKLRIFVSPSDTNVTSGGGDWESEGLIVAQVRVDLVNDDWIDRF